MNHVRKIPCLLCKEMASVVYDEFFFCKNCTFVFVSPAERLKQQGDFIYKEEFNVQVLASLKRKYPKELHKKRSLYVRIAEFLIRSQSLAEIRALDVGASGGFFLYELEKRGVSPQRLVSLEMSPNYTALTKEYFGYESLQKNLEDFSSREKFSFISLFDVLEHISDFETSLKILFQTLAPNGLLYLKLPTSNWVLFKVRILGRLFPQKVPQILYYTPGGHLNYWNPKNIHFIERFGFEVLETHLVKPTSLQFGWKYPAYLALYAVNRLFHSFLYPEFEVFLKKKTDHS